MGCCLFATRCLAIPLNKIGIQCHAFSLVWNLFVTRIIDMINTKLNALFQCWKDGMMQNGDHGFCEDGLIYRNGKESLLL